MGPKGDLLAALPLRLNRLPFKLASAKFHASGQNILFCHTWKDGRVRFIAAVLKTVDVVRHPGVRIPLLPPDHVPHFGF